MYVEINNLKKSYDGKIAIKVPNLSIQNSILGIVGKNGAGKSTFLYSILDLIRIDSGNILIEGVEHYLAESQLKSASFLDKDELLDFLTVKEYLNIVCSSFSITKINYTANFEEIEQILGESVFSGNKLIRDYSDGNKQLIGIIAAIITKMPFIIMDEPFNYLDVDRADKVIRLIKHFNKKYSPLILISSNSLDYVKEICTSMIVIENGEISKHVEPNDYENLRSIITGGVLC